MRRCNEGSGESQRIEAALGNNGVLLELSEGDRRFGTLRVGRAKVEWRRGKTRRGNGKSIGIKKLIALIEEHGS